MPDPGLNSSSTRSDPALVHCSRGRSAKPTSIDADPISSRSIWEQTSRANAGATSRLRCGLQCRLRLFAARLRLAQGLRSVVHHRQKLAGRIPTCEDVLHARAVRPHKSLERRDALLDSGELCGVELRFLRERARIAAHVFQDKARFAQRLRRLAIARVYPCHGLQQSARLDDRVYSAALPRERFVRTERRACKRFGVLAQRKFRHQLFVLPFQRGDFLYARQRETGLFDAFGTCTLRFLKAGKLRCGTVCFIPCRPVRAFRRRDGVAAPRVEQPKVLGLLEQALVLVLPAQVNPGAYGRRKLGNACKGAVDRHAAAPVR